MEIAGLSSIGGLSRPFPRTTMAPVREAKSGSRGSYVRKHAAASCADCYFRRAGLCALPGDRPCPTFRAAEAGKLEPPRQPRLVLRPLPTLAAHGAAA